MRGRLAVALLLVAVTAAADDCRRTFFNTERAVTTDGLTLPGDFDEDGKVDFVVQHDYRVFVMLNRGGGVYEPQPPSFSLAFSNGELFAVRDVDGDHHLDLVLKFYNSLWVAYGNGHGSFGEPLRVSSLPLAREEVIADLDGDGVDDFIELDGFTVTAWQIAPSGTLRKFADLRRTYDSSDLLSVGDYDGDGRPDVMTGAYDPVALVWRLELFFQQADHTFKKQTIVTNVAPGTISIDLDGGGAELVTRAQGHLLVNHIHDGELTSDTLEIPDLPMPESLRMFDFDHDGLADLVFTSRGAVGIAWAKAPGVFERPSMFDMLGRTMTIADVDGDGVEDLVTTHATEGIVVIHGKVHGRELDGAPIVPLGLSTPGVVLVAGISADFDDDGNADFAAVDIDGTISLVYGDGHGRFAAGPKGKLDTASGVRLAAADFDGDLRTDLAISSGGNTKILFGDGGRHFGTTSLALPETVAVAPLRLGASQPPALIAGQSGNVVAIAISSARIATSQVIDTAPPGTISVSPGGDVLVSRSDGLSIFRWTGAQWTSRVTTTRIDGSTTADVNGDGITDVIAPGAEVFLGNDHGTFDRTWYAQAPGNVLVSDVDGDGHLDLVLVTGSAGGLGSIRILRGDGTGSFVPWASALAGGEGISNAVLTDVDGDGGPDLLLLSMAGLEVLRNVCAAPRVEVAIVPARPAEGQRASFVAHALSTDWFTVGLVTVTENGLRIASGQPNGSQDFATLQWTSLPLKAGHHVYTLRYDDQYAGSSETTFEFDVATPAPQRRHSAH